MIGKIYDMLIQNHQQLKDQIYDIARYLEKEIGEKISNVWIEYEPNSSLNEKKFVAVDGGSFTKAMRIGIIYTVDAEVVRGDKEKVEIINEDGRIGIFKPGNDAKERANLLMEALELKLALESGKLGDYLLLDGSLTNKIGKKINTEKISKEELNIVESIDIDKIISIKNEEKMRELLQLLNQFLITRVLEEYDGNVLWISKTSRSRELFSTDYPDITVLELFTNSSGFTKPYIKTINQEKVSDVYELEFLRKMEYSVFYTRLGKGNKIIKIEIAGRIDESIAKEIIDDLSEVAIKGYPFPLLKVHMDVRISQNDRKRIIKLLGSKIHKDIEWWPSQFY